jgi:hypothetical protein
MIAARTTKAGTLALTIAALLAAGCGNDSPAVSAASETAAPTSAAPATATPGSEPGGSTPSDTGQVTIDTNFSGEGSGEVCRYAKELEQSGAFSGDTDLDKKQFDEFQSAVQNMEDKAPDEIKGDLDKFAQAIAALRSIYEKYDYDESKIAEAAVSDPDIAEALNTLSDPEFEQASGRVEAYFEQVCGISTS